jgi:glycosyltransferase involved in cell wall biosynthesis
VRVLMVSYTSLLQRAYRRKCDVLAGRRDVDLTVLVPDHWKELWAGGRRVEFEPGDGTEGYATVRRPVWFAGNGHLSLFRSGLGRILRDVRPDLIDLEREPWSFAAWQVLRLRRRECPGARLVFHASQNAFKTYPPPFRQIQRAVFRGADAALARSEAAARVLRAHGYKGRLEVVPHGVDTARFSPAAEGARPSSPVVGFAGALTPQKGVDVLLEAMARLDRRVQCRIVGDGPERARLEERARRPGLDDRVVFTGAVPHGRVPDELRRMTVFVLPARSLPGLEERFGRVLLEAMATGLPVVATETGEIPEVLGAAGVRVPPEDPAALASALGRITGDPEGGWRAGLMGRARVEAEFAWERVAERTLRVYDEVLGRRA